MRYTPSFTCNFLLEVFSVSYLGQIADCLQGVYSESSISHVCGCLQGCILSVTWVSSAVFCRECVNSVSYIKQISSCLQVVCTLSVTYGRVAVICWGILCQLHDADWRLSARGVWTLSYTRQVGSCQQRCVYFVGCLIKIDDCLQRVYSGFMVCNTTFNNISGISWWSVLLVSETRVPGENHLSAASHWQALTYNDHIHKIE